jgi:hypothetical protein
MFLVSWLRQNARKAAAPAVAAIVAAAAMYVVQELRMREQRIAFHHHETQLRAVLAAPDAMLKAAQLRDGGTITLISSRQRDTAIVVLKEAKPTGQDRAYQIWLMEGTDSRSIGLLQPNQTDATLVFSVLRDKRALGVTIERAAGQVSPTLPLVAEIVLSP